AFRTNGFAIVGDGGAALYKRVASEPTHAGKVMSADGAWWELAEKNTSTISIGGNLINWLASAGTKPAVVDEGTWSLPSLLNISDLKNRMLRGVNRLTSIIKRG